MPEGIGCNYIKYTGEAIELEIKNNNDFDMVKIKASIDGKGCEAKTVKFSTLEPEHAEVFRLVCSPPSGAFRGDLRFIYTDATGEYYNQVGEIVINIPPKSG